MMKDQAPAQPFTLFDQKGIQITLNLPAALQINQNRQELFTTAPVLHNNTDLSIASASFVIKLDDVVDGSSNVIANVRWWNADIFDGAQTMTFTCGAIAPGATGTCAPTRPGYSQVRWGTTVSSGRGIEALTNTLSLVSLTFGPVPEQTNPNGPVVQIG